MGIIKNIVPKQNFELVDERLGEILTLELSHQKTLQNFSDPVNVYSERLDVFDHSEKVMVNVFYDSSNDFDETQKGSQGKSRYFVDVYASGESGTGISGGLASSKRLHKFLGMCRYILSDSQYRTLGFEPGSIGGVSVESIQIANLETKSSTYDTMGRLTVSVRLKEDQVLETGVLMTKHLTGVKLDLTDLGYKYEITN